MVTLEQVEKLKERANISYEDAKAALEISGGDLLEAVIYLERQGKINGPEMGSYNTQTGGATAGAICLTSMEQRGGAHGDKRDHGDFKYHKYHKYHKQYGPPIKQNLEYFWQKIKEFVRKTNTNQFEISREDRRVVSMPLTLLIVSAIFFFWVTLPLLIIALFLGFRYHINGPDFGKDSVNNVMDKAADTAESIKRAMTQEKDEQADEQENRYEDE